MLFQRRAVERDDFRKGLADPKRKYRWPRPAKYDVRNRAPGKIGTPSIASVGMLAGVVVSAGGGTEVWGGGVVLGGGDPGCGNGLGMGCWAAVAVVSISAASTPHNVAPFEFIIVNTAADVTLCRRTINPRLPSPEHVASWTRFWITASRSETGWSRRSRPWWRGNRRPRTRPPWIHAAASGASPGGYRWAHRLSSARSRRRLSARGVWLRPLADPAARSLRHYWPARQLARMPIAVRDGRLYGPGTFDMKAGIAIAMVAARALAEVGPQPDLRIVMLWTTDEETGSATSRSAVDEEARRSDACWCSSRRYRGERSRQAGRAEAKTGW